MSRTFQPHIVTDDSALGGTIINGSLYKQSDQYLEKVFGSTGDRTKYTESIWVKRGGNDYKTRSVFGITCLSDPSYGYEYISFDSSDRLDWYAQSNGSSWSGWLQTKRKFRGTGWFHVVRVLDTSNSTSGDRLRLYVNGERVTEFENANYPSSQAGMNRNTTHYLHRHIGTVNDSYSGYVTEHYYVDGLALDPSHFGYTESSTGEWRPKKYTGTYGTHGFYLPNDGSSQIGRDQSGSNNHWEPRNLNQGVTNIEKATGGLPILNTNSSGTVGLAGVRHDPLASYVVLALPLSGGSSNSQTTSPTTGQDFSKLINGSTTEKQTDNNGDIPSVVSDPNFYGSSVYFANTNSDIMNVRELNSGSTGSNDFEFTGDYCIEMYVNPRDFGAADGSLWVTSNGSQYHAFNLDPGNQFNIYFNSGSASWQPTVSHLDYNNWNHVALTREGSTVRLFVNGLLAQDTTSSGTHGYGQGANLARIGGGGSGALNAYIQDLRIYKGTAKYTTDFVCPFTRSQIRPDTPTGITPRTFNDSVITTQGSAMFDGSLNYMQLHTNAAFNFGSGDFTVEAYVFMNDYGSHCQIWSNNDMDFKISGNPGRIRLYTSSGSLSLAVVPRRRWVHVATCRSSGTFYVAVDGKVGFDSNGAPAAFTSTASQAAAIGTRTRSVGNELFKGHISNLRVIKGTALYTSNFTPPTEPLTNVNNTVLLGLQSSTDATSFTVSAGGFSNVNGGTSTPVQASKLNPFDDIHNGALSTEYAVLNAQATFSRNCTFFNGGMDVTIPASNKYGRAFSSLEARSGKYYWEVTYTSSVGDYLYIGVGAISHNRPYYYIRGSDGEKSYHAGGNNNNSSGTTCRFTANDVMGVYLDLDAKKWYLTVNGVFQDCGNGIGNPVAGTGYVHSGIELDYGYGGYSNGIGAHFANATGGGSQTFHVNFGQEPFKYPPLDGYKTLSVNNLNSSTINDPEKHFKAVTWTGDGAAVKTITGLKFKPDFVWLKCRNTASTNHGMCNSVCEDGSGNKTMLYPNNNDAETVGGNYFVLYTATGLQPFIDNGFRINNNGSGNGSGRTFVAWCWKAGGAAVTNNDGSITSTVSANTEAGFSIVTYDGSGSAGSTVGHGLNQAPEFMLVKARDRNDRYWINWHKPGGNTNYMDYNTNGTLISQGSYNMFNSTAPSATVITLGDRDNVNNSINKYVIYCWHSVPGFSKVGHYRGTGDAHGPFVYTGFKPAMIWIKNYDINGEEWMIYDNARDSDNPNAAALYANQYYAESDGTQYTGGNSRNIDFLSHGFKITDTGNPINHPSGEDTDHVFIAFAEKPESSQFGGHNLSK